MTHQKQTWTHCRKQLHGKSDAAVDLPQKSLQGACYYKSSAKAGKRPLELCGRNKPKNDLTIWQGRMGWGGVATREGHSWRYHLTLLQFRAVR